MGMSDPIHETYMMSRLWRLITSPHYLILSQYHMPRFYWHAIVFSRIFPWTDSSPHARQRLLECVAGGLHLNNHNITPFLQAALDTFPVQDFFTPSNVLTSFALICSGLPDWASNALFCKQFFPKPSLVPSPPIPVIQLPTFPQTTTIADLHDAFLDIFTYLEGDFSIDLLNPAFLCSSPSFPLTLSSLILQTISHRFSLSDEAKQRTSQPNRPIVLRLCSVLLELSPSTDIPTDSELSPHLLAEEFHSDSSSVTIYCPIKGLHIIPISTLFPYHISAVLFKRSSQSHLVSPLLLRKFASFSIPKPIPNSATPFAIISLFDGSGSFSDVISTAVGEWPACHTCCRNGCQYPYCGLQGQRLASWRFTLVLWQTRCTHLLCTQCLDSHPRFLSFIKTIPFSPSFRHYYLRRCWISHVRTSLPLDVVKVSSV